MVKLSKLSVIKAIYIADFVFQRDEELCQCNLTKLRASCSNKVERWVIFKIRLLVQISSEIYNI